MCLVSFKISSSDYLFKVYKFFDAFRSFADFSNEFSTFSVDKCVLTAFDPFILIAFIILLFFEYLWFYNNLSIKFVDF